MFRDLHPELRPWADWLYRVAEANGLRPVVTSTLRTRSEQQRLFDRYRRGESDLPAARPGTSLHEQGLAFDMVVADARSQRAIGELWESVGGRWGGRFSDPPHFEIGR